MPRSKPAKPLDLPGRADAAGSSERRAQLATVAAEPFPLVLQRRASATIRGHVRRAVVRLCVLIAADISVLVLLRFLFRGVGDQAWLGGRVATVARALVPSGEFPYTQFVLAVMIGLVVFGTYRPGDHRRAPAKLFSAAALGLALVFWARAWEHNPWLSLIAFAAALPFLGLALCVERMLVDRVVRRVRPVGDGAVRTLVVGTGPVVHEAMTSPALSDAAEFRVVGHWDVGRAFERHGKLADLVWTIEAKHVEGIVLAGSFDNALFIELVNLADAAGCHVYSFPVEFVRGDIEPQLVWRRGAPLMQLTRPGARGPQLAIKRCVDIVGPALALLVLSPLLALIALAVRLSSSGPILFKQMRVGQGGRPFCIYKFRTMIRDAEAQRNTVAAQSIYGDLRLFKVKDDPRVTPVGRFLRRTSLDELPQLWNVLRGDMSLVGPRPPLPCEVELYEEHHYTRFDMKPGMTGPWQVSGRNRITDFDEVLQLEFSYLRQWSIWKDIDILVRTIPEVLKMKGAH